MATDGDSGFAPGDIAKKDFPTTFRGYDQDLVRDYLRRLSFFLEQNEEDPLESDDVDVDLVGENRALKKQLKQLQRSSSTSSEEPDDGMVFELLGNETTRILETARSAAKDIVQRAEDRAATLTEKSETDAQAARQEAQNLLANKQKEAAGMVSKITDDASRQAERLIADGENKHKRSVAESKRILSEARDRADFERASSESEANQILAQASKRREEVLTDLVERRREGHHQLNQLASARNALVRSLGKTSSELSNLLTALSEKIELQASESDIKTVESKFDEVDSLVRDLDRGRTPRKTGFADYDPSSSEEDDIDINLDSADDAEPSVGLTEEMVFDDSTDIVELKLDDLPRLADIDDEPDVSEALDSVDLEVDDPDDEVALDAADETTVGRSESYVSKPGRSAEKGSTVLDETTTVSEEDNKPDGSAVRAKRSRPAAVPEPDVIDVEQDQSSEISVFDELEAEAEEDLSKEIPLLAFTDGVPESVKGDTARSEKFDGKLAGEFVARDVAITRFGPAIRRRLRRALNDDQSDVLNRLQARGSSRKSKVTPDDLPALGEQLKTFVEPLEEGLEDLANAGLSAGEGTALPTEALHHLALQVAKHMVQNLRTPTVDLVEKSVDGDREALHDPIRDLYRSVRSTVLDAVLEDAINEAFSLGLFAGIERDAKLVWMLDPRCEPAPLCEINAAAVGIRKGVSFPSGHTRPLAMPGCRCLVLAHAKL